MLRSSCARDLGMLLEIQYQRSRGVETSELFVKYC
jgi:hypothetical protein